jgi:predicted phage-related endonuclease
MRIPITNRAEWLSRRRFDVTASAIGALFDGCHPYISPLRLFVEKQGLIDLPAQKDAGPLRRGRVLEPAVAAAVAEQRPDWQLEKGNEYFRDEELSLGGTPDYFIHGDPRGPGLLQAKTTAPSVFDRDWHDGKGELTIPRYILLQAHTELLLTDATFGVVAVLVVDPYELPCVIIEVSRDPAQEQDIRDRVIAFWKDIEAGRQPDIDLAKDRSLLKELTPHETPGLAIDLSQDNEIVSSLIERRNLKESIKKDELQCEKIEALVMARMGVAEFATVPEFSVTWKTQKRREFTVPAKEGRVLTIRNKRE